MFQYDTPPHPLLQDSNVVCVILTQQLFWYGCNGHEVLSSITLTHIIKQRNIALIVVLHFTVTVEFSTISLIHTLK
jgi:hypothetical protein